MHPYPKDPTVHAPDSSGLALLISVCQTRRRCDNIVVKETAFFLSIHI
jgi:hypothetical protein